LIPNHVSAHPAGNLEVNPRPLCAAADEQSCDHKARSNADCRSPRPAQRLRIPITVCRLRDWLGKPHGRLI